MKKLSDNAKILLLTSGGQDYMQDDLLYGFRKIFGGRAVDYPKKSIMYADFEGQVHPRAEYAMNARYFRNDPVDRELPIEELNPDLTINLSCRRIKAVSDIAVDGEDDMRIDAPDCKLLFKRELDPRFEYDGILPITFGLPDHLSPLMSSAGLFNSKKTEIHSSFTVQHGPNRRELAAAFPVEMYPTRRAYIEAINESKYVLSPMGAGYDCQRHYEILGRAVPIIEVNEDAPRHFQEMWRDGENCLTFWKDPAIIRDKIAATTKSQWDDMVACGYEEIHNKYTASAVAWDLLVKAGVV